MHTSDCLQKNPFIFTEICEATISSQSRQASNPHVHSLCFKHILEQVTNQWAAGSFEPVNGVGDAAPSGPFADCRKGEVV